MRLLRQIFGLPVAAMIAASVALSVVAVPASAQETIFDPENPAAEDEPDDEVDDGDAMIIDDPERPDLPEEETLQGDDASTAAPGFDNTEWELNYELGTLIDPRWGPTGQDALEWVGGLGMGIRHEPSEQTRIVVSGRFQYWAGSGREFDEWRTLYEPRIDRAYIIHRTGPWSLALGQMRNSWGSTDIIRPGDVIDPVDMRAPMTSDGVGTGLGQLSATASYSGSDWSLQALVVPFFENNRVTLFGRDTALAHERNPLVAEQLPFLLLAQDLIHPSIQQDIQPFFQSTQRPHHLPKNASGGLRGTWTVSGFDLGLGVFYGWDRTPEVFLDDDLRQLLVLIAEDGQIFEDYDIFGFGTRNPEAFEHSQNLSEKAEAGETIFESKFRRRATFLADFARYVGPIGVRADVAFSPRRVFYTTDFDAVQRATLFSALGLSYERLLDGVRPLALTIEGFWLHPFSTESPIHQALVPDGRGGDEDDELLLFEEGYYGVAGASNWAMGWWDLELIFGAIASISPGDLMGRFAIERPWARGLRTTVGVNFFLGPDPEEQLTPGGLWAHNDRIHLGISGQF